jgi:endoglucanase
MRTFSPARGALLVLLAALSTPASPAPAPAPTQSAEDEGTEELVRQAQKSWFAAEWKDWKARFLQPDGRVVDNGNNGASHSEGQGYGMLLATYAQDRAGFDLIWGWTEHNLFVRLDGLAAWRWDEGKKSVADKNNATDGDLLIAWALLRASSVFDEPRFRDRAKAIADAIGRTLVLKTPGGPVLLPGAFGFQATDQPDGPILNLSYFVFPALDALAPLAPDVPWGRIKATGLKLVSESRFGPMRLPADWVSVAGKTPQPAKNFPATFGYDAVRIPLYLAWTGSTEAQAGRFASLEPRDGRTGPSVIDLKTGAALRPIDGVGFRLIVALSRCLGSDATLPEALIASRDTFYYPATLRLLTMALIAERYPECL